MSDNAISDAFTKLLSNLQALNFKHDNNQHRDDEVSFETIS